MNSLSVIASLSLAFLLQPWTSEHEDLWSDFDADGRSDVLLVAPDGSLRLFLNGADGSMRQADPTWGLAPYGGVQRAVAGDADGDGAVDLFLMGAGGEHRLLRNLGKSFVDVTAQSGLANLGELRSASWLDYDGDGQLDLSISPVGGGLAVMRNTQDLSFTSVPVAALEPLAARGWSPSQPTAPAADDRTTSSATSTSGLAGLDRTARGGVGGGREERPGSTTGVQNVMGPGTTMTAAPQPHTPIWGCAQDVVDQDGGPCIKASRSPKAGQLLALGDRFYIDPLGRVGFNETSPDTDLHVYGGSLSDLRLASSQFLGLGTSTIQMAIDRDFDNGMEIKVNDAGLGISTRRPAQGGIPVTFGPHLYIERNASGFVGINTDDPETAFHVNGRSTFDYTMSVRRPDDVQTILLDPSYSGGGGSARMVMYQSDGALGVVLDAENSVNSGSKLTMYGDNGSLRVELDADDGGSSFMRLYKSNNTPGIILDASQNGDARITTEVLEITGGADLVESFDTGDVVCLPGTVVAIDPDRPGELTPSSVPYDTRVAGIVSGAGGVQPGLHMGQTGVASGSTPVALTGRVYVRCSGENGAIRPGDMLTTSSTSGVAMRASDPARSFGAVIGKAMSALPEGEGLVLVLVNLQ